MTTVADGLKSRLHALAQLLKGRQMVPLDVVALQSPAADVAVPALGLQDLFPEVYGAVAALGPEQLEQDLLGQGGQLLPAPLDLLGQSLQPLQDPVLVLDGLFHEHEALGPVLLLGAFVGKAHDGAPSLQGDLGIPPALQEPSPHRVEVRREIVAGGRLVVGLPLRVFRMGAPGLPPQDGAGLHSLTHVPLGNRPGALVEVGVIIENSVGNRSVLLLSGGFNDLDEAPAAHQKIGVIV